MAYNHSNSAYFNNYTLPISCHKLMLDILSTSL